MESDSQRISTAMLKAVIAGKTYNDVAAEHGVTRTAVERRIKSLALKLNRDVGIEGMNQEGIGFVLRLRACNAAILKALAGYTPGMSSVSREGRILSDQDIDLAVRRTRTRSSNPLRDVALLYILLSTGARPLEIARLEVRDYLDADGGIREESSMRPEVAINRHARPLFFASQNVVDAIDRYLADRARLRFGTSGCSQYRGLDPHSRLFLTETGFPFEIVSESKPGRQHFLCRGILDTYRAIFRRVGLDGVSALKLRRTVAARLQQRGAVEDQIGEVLGISEMKTVRELLPNVRRPLRAIVRELV